MLLLSGLSPKGNERSLHPGVCYAQDSCSSLATPGHVCPMALALVLRELSDLLLDHAPAHGFYLREMEIAGIDRSVLRKSSHVSDSFKKALPSLFCSSLVR